MRPLIFVLMLALLGGCAWFGGGDDNARKEAEDRTRDFTEKDFYDSIQAELTARNWTKAIENLEALEARFPFGTYAEQAQLELVYAYHESLNFEAAIAAADRFIRLHPRHPSVDYAHYVKGMALLNSGRGLFEQYLPRDASTRDPGAARQAFNTFSELLNSHPDSSYAPDARQHMVYLRNLLARQEIHAANYYFKRGAYLAATNRGRYVMENYQQTPAMADALAVMAQGYHMLDLPELAANAEHTLKLNFPDHSSLDSQGNFRYQDDMLDEDSWWHKLTLGRFTPEKPPYFDSRPEFQEDGEQAAPNLDAEPAKKRSWLNWLTFGLLG
jgi:outer membrane protein assembly factor BamD